MKELEKDFVLISMSDVPESQVYICSSPDSGSDL